MERQTLAVGEVGELVINGPEEAEQIVCSEYGYPKSELYPGWNGVKEDVIVEQSGRKYDPETGKQLDSELDERGIAKRITTPEEKLKELQDNKEEVVNNPYLDFDKEKEHLEKISEKEKSTGIKQESSLYPGNDGFAGERHA